MNDCRRLLQGEQVAFVKTEETWAMDLNQIWKTISGETVKPLNDQSGLSYSEYLRLCLYLEPEQVIVSRMADLIQYRMKQYNPSFRLDECLSKAAINCSGEFAGLFSSSHIFLPIRPFYRFEMDRIFQYED